jgi:3-deoxy-D-manno-octulosonic-acid transferase
LFRLGVGISSLFNDKARKWVHGRRGIFEKLEKEVSHEQGLVWMHCASLGEFEQGRPLMESIRKQWPEKKILLTFFSPSGYEVKKEYDGADWVYYLPLDGAVNARKFLEITKPSLVIFVKYEFWYYYLKKIKYRNIPLILVSAHFLKEMSFFKWYGTLQRKMLSRFDHIFVQNDRSRALLKKIGLHGIATVCGDTRFDRVIGISEEFTPIPKIDAFTKDSKVIVAGSTWPNDELIIQSALENLKEQNFKLILAPHEITEEHLDEIEERFPGAKRFSTFDESDLPHTKVLVIDNIGMLSRLYKYSTVSYIGGGFSKSGIHNILEAAVYGKPVFFGPNFSKYREAVELIKLGGAGSVESGKELSQAIIKLLENAALYNETCEASLNYVWVNKGATRKIVEYLQEKRLLTR